MKILALFSLLLLTSCASYVNSFHRELDRAEREESSLDIEENGLEQVRKTPRKTSMVYNNPDMRTTKNTNYLAPSVKREYKSEKAALKRVTASDLTDSGSDGSLWASNDQNAFLFSDSRNKSSGDIVQINVQPRLRNEITLELKKNFPDNPFEKRADGQKDGAPGAPGATPETAQAAAQANDQSANDGGSDKISSVVIEEINRDHLLVRGRKNVLFKNKKRMIEVQALVSRKHITDDDIINSDEIIESSVQVVR